MRYTAAPAVSRSALLLSALAVAVRPWLWPVALRLLSRSAESGWWRTAPFLPIPSAEYMNFRYATAYGHSGRPRGRDLVAYLTWCRATNARAD